jgi:hypothetical protein
MPEADKSVHPFFVDAKRYETAKTALTEAEIKAIANVAQINDGFPHKRHQKRHLDFCIAHLLSRMPLVRVLPGAPPYLIWFIPKD